MPISSIIPIIKQTNKFRHKGQVSANAHLLTVPQTKAIDEPQIWHVYLSQDIDTTDRALKGRRIGFLSPI